MGFFPFAGTGPLQKQVSTPPGGFALQNATPNILTWTTPNDGNLHVVMINVLYVVTVNLTGGALNGTGTVNIGTIIGSNLAVGSYGCGAGVENYPLSPSLMLLGNQTVNLNQAVAASAGAGIVYAQIWGN